MFNSLFTIAAYTVTCGVLHRDGTKPPVTCDTCLAVEVFNNSNIAPMISLYAGGQLEDADFWDDLVRFEMTAISNLEYESVRQNMLNHIHWLSEMDSNDRWETTMRTCNIVDDVLSSIDAMPNSPVRVPKMPESLRRRKEQQKQKQQRRTIKYDAWQPTFPRPDNKKSYAHYWATIAVSELGCVEPKLDTTENKPKTTSEQICAFSHLRVFPAGQSKSMFHQYAVITTRAIMETVTKIRPLPVFPERPPDMIELLEAGLTPPEIRMIDTEYMAAHTLPGVRYNLTNNIPGKAGAGIVSNTWNYGRGIRFGTTVMKDWPLILIDNVAYESLNEVELRSLVRQAAGEGGLWDDPLKSHDDGGSKAYDIFKEKAFKVKVKLKIDPYRFGRLEQRDFWALFRESHKMNTACSSNLLGHFDPNTLTFKLVARKDIKWGEELMVRDHRQPASSCIKTESSFSQQQKEISSRRRQRAELAERQLKQNMRQCFVGVCT